MPFKTTSGTGYGYLAVEDERIVEVLHEEDKSQLRADAGNNSYAAEVLIT
jgi:hypothetical protein